MQWDTFSQVVPRAPSKMPSTVDDLPAIPYGPISSCGVAASCLHLLLPRSNPTALDSKNEPITGAHGALFIVCM